MDQKRSVGHYREHELVCEATLTEGGWRYRLSIVRHHGDTSEVKRVESQESYGSDVEALRAGEVEGHRIIDQRLDESGN